MSNEEQENRCNAQTRDGGHCANFPVKHPDGTPVNGRCRMHGGTNSGAPENNGNAESHGMESDPEKWFERHREEVGDEVRDTVANAVEKCPFGWDDTLKMKKLVSVAINEEQVRLGDEYIEDEGIMVDKIVDTDEYGDPITEDGENPAFLSKSRLQKDSIRILKELGYLDDPDSEQADATQSLVDILSE